MECCLIMRSIRGNPVFSWDRGSLLSVLTQCKLASKKNLSCLEYLISTNHSKTVSALPDWNPMLLLYFQILVYDYMWLFCFHNYILYPFRLNLFLLKLKTDNWKYGSKIIFKYVNSTARPVNNAWTMFFVPCTVNSCDFIVHARKKKSKKKKKKERLKT